MSLVVDGSVVSTNTTGINNTNYTFTNTVTTGLHNWTCTGTDNTSQSTTPDVRFFTVKNLNHTLDSPEDKVRKLISANSMSWNIRPYRPGAFCITHLSYCIILHRSRLDSREIRRLLLVLHCRKSIVCKLVSRLNQLEVP